MAIKPGLVHQRISSSIVFLRFFKVVLIVVLLRGAVDVACAQSSPSAKSSVRSALQRGQEALRKGDLVTARQELEKAVRLAPGDAPAQAMLGWVLAQQGQGEAAVPHLRAALKTNPGYV